MNRTGAIATLGIIMAGVGSLILGLSKVTPNEEIFVASRFVRAHQGKLVRFVNVQVKHGDVITDNEDTVGRGVIRDECPDNAVCHVVMDATKEFMEENFKTFVMIPESCVDKKCVWSVLLKGKDCRMVGDLKEYLCSNMHACLKLSLATRQRFLRQTEHAGPTDPWFFPHGWMGRSDLNFVDTEWDSENGVHKPKPRYEIEAQQIPESP